MKREEVRRDCQVSQPISYCRWDILQIWFSIFHNDREWRMKNGKCARYSILSTIFPPHSLIHLLTHSRFMPLRSNQEKILSFIVMASKHDNNDWTRFSRKFYTDADLIWLLLLFFSVVVAPSSSFDTCHNSRVSFHTYLLVRFRKLQAVRCQRDKNI